MKKNIVSVSISLFCLVAGGSLAAFAETKLEKINEVFEPKGDFPSERFWKVAVVQTNMSEPAPIHTTPEKVAEYKQKNREFLAQKIRTAAINKAKYIVLPEFAAIGYPEIPNAKPEEDDYQSREDVAPFVETIPGPTVTYFADLAKELHVWLQYGLAEVDPKTQIYYNAVVVLNDQGQVVAQYRKQNLFGIEGRFVSPGEKPVIFQTPAGRFGVAICADIYSKKVLRQYKKLKLDALGMSASWASHNSAMKNFKKGAIFMRTHVLAANQNYFPDSGVVDPDGTTQSHIRQSLDSIAYGYLPLKK